jgi:hypothetical protein
MEKGSAPSSGFSRSQLVMLLAIGVPALLITLLCMSFIMIYSGPQFDVVIINDHVVGGTEDKLVAWVVGSVAGATAVFCGTRLWTRTSEWRQGRSFTDR